MAPSQESIILTHDELEYEKLHAYGLELTGSSVFPMVLNATTEMGLLQLIHDHMAPNGIGISAAELVAQIKAQNPDTPSILDRTLRLLATYSVVACTTVTKVDGGIERRYKPTPVSRMFVPDENGASSAPMLSMIIDRVFLSNGRKLKEAVLKGGILFNVVHGMNVYEYCGKDPRFNEVFHNAMSQATMNINDILAKYKGFDTVRKLVNVGGSLGHNIASIVSQYPFIQGINFDLPHVVKSATPSPGVEHIGGDLFESVPNGDAIFMKWILHNWSDEHCLKLLTNCYKALPDNGKVIMVEMIVPHEIETTEIGRASSILDLFMMMQSIGKERTLLEYETLAKAAGFYGINLQCCARGLWLFEIYK